MKRQSYGQGGRDGHSIPVGSGISEAQIESAALAWLESLGWQVKHGPDISPAGDTLTLALSQRERESYSEVVLEQRLRDALARLDPALPAEALEDAVAKRQRPGGSRRATGGIGMVRR